MPSLFVLPNHHIHAPYGGDTRSVYRLSKPPAFDCYSDGFDTSDSEMDELPVPPKGLTGSREGRDTPGSRVLPMLGGAAVGAQTLKVAANRAPSSPSPSDHPAAL